MEGMLAVQSTPFFLISNNAKKIMEHWRIAKQKFSNKKKLF